MMRRCVIAMAGVACLGALAMAEDEPPVNRVSNGSFETLDEAGHLPRGWTTKHPDNVIVIRTDDPRGHVVQMTGDKKLMGTYGTDLLSSPVQFKPNTRYRCTGWTRSDGPNMIVFVKGYATVTRKVDGKRTTFDDAVYQMKKEIKGTKEWTKFNLDFDVTPAKIFSDFQHEVKYLRILLWGYWPAGTCWYDDIRFEEVGPVPQRDDRPPLDQALTHTGEAPRLGPAAYEQPRFDAEQTWVDAANALTKGEAATAYDLSRQLVTHDAADADYRLLCARAAAGADKPEAAAEHIKWLLDPAQSQGDPPRAQPWQVQWAHLVEAELLAKAGEIDRARAILQAVLEDSDSPHVQHAAKAAMDALSAPER